MNSEKTYQIINSQTKGYLILQNELQITFKYNVIKLAIPLFGFP